LKHRMINWDTFSEQLQEWRDNPVTEILKSAVESEMEFRRQMVCQLYLAGKPVPEEYRVALGLMDGWVSEFFEADANDIKAQMMQFAEEEGLDGYVN
jgi:hypothetical protein